MTDAADPIGFDAFAAAPLPRAVMPNRMVDAATARRDARRQAMSAGVKRLFAA